MYLLSLLFLLFYFISGAQRAKRDSLAPWVNKSTHPRKFGNHVTDFSSDVVYKKKNKIKGWFARTQIYWQEFVNLSNAKNSV